MVQLVCVSYGAKRHPYGFIILSETLELSNVDARRVIDSGLFDVYEGARGATETALEKILEDVVFLYVVYGELTVLDAKET